MELILKEDVENLGFKDDVVKVKNGYGRNFLIPNGLAMLATESNKKVLAEKIKQSHNKQKKAIDEAEKIVKKLEKLDLKIAAKALEGDKLFGSITSADISKELAENMYVSPEDDYHVHIGSKEYFEILFDEVFQ